MAHIIIDTVLTITHKYHCSKYCLTIRNIAITDNTVEVASIKGIFPPSLFNNRLYTNIDIKLTKVNINLCLAVKRLDSTSPLSYLFFFHIYIPINCIGK